MKTEWRGFEITSEFIGEKASSFDPDSHDRHHRITVKNLKSGYSKSFDYWTSKAHPEIEEESELLDAFECWITDAEFGDYSLVEFLRENGYDVPDNIVQSWKGCQKAHNQVVQILGTNWRDIADELREEING